MFIVVLLEYLGLITSEECGVVLGETQRYSESKSLRKKLRGGRKLLKRF